MSTYLDVTTENFDDVFETLPALVQKCRFVAIDLEMSGLDVRPETRFFWFDDLETRYEKVKVSASNFEIFQVGLTFFMENVPKTVTGTTLNFNIFKTHKRNEHAHTFQNSSLKFLRENHMDFNKIIDFGIPYINASEFKVMEAAQSYKIPLSKLNQDDLAWLKSVRFELTEWYEGSSDKKHDIYPATRFHKRLLFENFEEFKNDVFLTPGKDESMRDLVSFERTTENVADLKEREKKKVMGFSRVISLLKGIKRPVVFHNGIFDLAHIYHKFVDNLPSSVYDFKKGLSELFPLVVDTKYVASSHPDLKRLLDTHRGKNSRVTDLYQGTLHWEECKVEPMSQENACEHEAGYDSFLTGSIFAHLFAHLGGQYFKDFVSVRPIVAFSNVVFLVRFSGGFHIDHSQQPVEQNNDHVFLVTSFPKGWSNSQITKPFEKFGNARVCFIDSTRAFVYLQKGRDNRTFDIDGCKREMTRPDLNREFVVTPFYEAQRLGILKTIVHSCFDDENLKKRKMNELETEIMGRRKKQKTCAIF